jgi:hypothetical protein
LADDGRIVITTSLTRAASADDPAFAAPSVTIAASASAEAS